MVAAPGGSPGRRRSLARGFEAIGRLSRSRICWAAALGWIMGLAVSSGCGTPPKVFPVLSPGATTPQRAWWVLDSHSPWRGPILGLEMRRHAGRVEQWLLGAEGGRQFIYQRGGLKSWGPPLPPDGHPREPVTRRVLLYTWTTKQDGVEGDAVPQSDADVAAFVGFLRERFPSLEVNPPPHLGLAEARRALFDFPLGLKELLSLQMGG